jgi:predicted transport protein
MKLTTGINIIGGRNIEKTLSKKILLANTTDKVINAKAQKKAMGSSSDPVYFTNDSAGMIFNPDIRYRTTYAFSPLTSINYRNDLLLFAENNEIKKAVNVLANETVIMDTETNKYPVYPKINFTLLPEDKQDVAKAIDEYLNMVFYPKLYQYYDFKEDGLIDTVKEFIITGKLAFEIVYDNLKNPHDIIGVIAIDPSSLQKFKEGDYIYFVQKSLSDNNGKQRILQENQVILVEWNKFDFGYLSYVDRLRMSFNIMRSMQTSKILWFAAKSQVRMHIKLAMGDVARTEAIQKLTESKNQYINHFTFSDDGIVKFNDQPNNSGYREFFTAETAASGSPEIEEINTQGPDLTEVDSLQYWEKLFWKDTDIPYDRIDPNSSDSWGFTDVTSLRKIEVNFGKFINSIRKMLNPIFLKPIIIQLTLKESEIGVDLSLIDSIKMDWIAFNEYEKLAEIEVMQKRVELATSIAEFGELEDVNGVARKAIPIGWIMKQYLQFTQEQLKSMDLETKIQNKQLGFPDETVLIDDGKETDETEEEEKVEPEESEDTPEDIQKFEDEKFKE